MPENVTDEQVESSRERVDRLRAEVAAEKAKVSSDTRSAENAYRKEALDREAERYEAELAQLREARQADVPTPTPTPVSTPITQPATAPEAEDDDKE